MRPSTLTTMLTDVLDACVAAFNEADTNDAPEIAYVTHGQPMVTGEQLVVWSPGIRPMNPFPLTRVGAVKNTVVPGADIQIELWRSCWPSPTPQSPATALPTPQQLTDAATSLADDASALFGYLANRATAGDLFVSSATVGTSFDVALSPMVPLGPQGLLAGWRWPLAVKLALP